MADEPTPPTGGDKTFTQAQLEEELGKRLARERAKYADYDELKAKAAQLDEMQAATQTETEKLAKKLADAEVKATQAQADALRATVAHAKGLTADQAEFLTGTTREDLEAKADKILALSGPAGEPASSGAPGKPAETLTGGGDPTTEPTVDVAAIVDSIDRRF